MVGEGLLCHQWRESDTTSLNSINYTTSKTHGHESSPGVSIFQCLRHEAFTLTNSLFLSINFMHINETL
jgi:hypothetical protein